jgi:predicted amidophosphoribosyltransferase
MNCAGHPVIFTHQTPGSCPGCGETVTFIRGRCEVDGEEFIVPTADDAEKHGPCLYVLNVIEEIGQ